MHYNVFYKKLIKLHYNVFYKKLIKLHYNVFYKDGLGKVSSVYTKRQNCQIYLFKNPYTSQRNRYVKTTNKESTSYKFDNTRGIQKVLRQILKKNFKKFQDGIFRWKHRLQKCYELDGNYVEK